MAKKKQIEEFENFNEIVEEQPLDDIMGSRYASYAKYVIQDRAIPDARDGLKPVQRRIIYAMQKAGLTYSSKRTKCARIVGDVMGHYHPHGDTSIYDALVRLAQDWKVNHPLIDFQGNKGSIDGDGPAAYRYTEARLSQIAEEMVRDIDKNVIDMELTYDDSQYEPTVLPSRFPNLLVNGSDGIAVALATEIPTHNLSEIIDATIYRIRNKNCAINELINIVQGPDFPTGGLIYKSKGIEDIYLTGRGKIEIVGKTEIIYGKDINQIVISEIPFKVQKKDLAFEIDKLRFDRSVSGIIEVRDESDLKHFRIVVDLKKEAKADIILEYLKNKTPLRTSYSANMVAIVSGHPKTMNLIDFIDCYINHQLSVLTKRSIFLLAINKKRLNIVIGLIKAISIIDDLIKVIRASKDKGDAKNNIQKEFGFNEEQAEAIVSLQLYRLTNTDILTLENEKNSLLEDSEYLQSLLDDEKKLRRLLISDLMTIKNKYGRPRLTQIIDKEETKTFNRRDLISKEETMIALTHDGYIKRSSLKSYRSSGENPLPGLKDGDAIVYIGKAITTDYLIAFTSTGNFLHIPVYEIQENKWKDEGKHINYLISLKPEDKIVKAFVLNNFREDLYFVLVSKHGQIKRVAMNNFNVVRYNRPITAMRLFNDDKISDVTYSQGDSNIFVATSEGYASFFNENQISPSLLKSSGIKAMSSLRNDATIASVLAFKKEERQKLLLITDNGSYRIFEIANMPLTNRLARPFSLYKYLKSDVQHLIKVMKIAKDEDNLLIRALLSDKNYFEFNVDDFHLTPMDKCARKILKIPHRASLDFVYDEKGIYIDNKIESYQPDISTSKLGEEQNVIENEQSVKNDGYHEDEQQEENYEQISIFDDDLSLD